MSGTRAQRELGRRLLLQLIGLALLLTFVNGAIALLLVNRAFERHAAGELARRRAAVEQALDRRSRHLASSLEWLDGYLRNSEPALLARLLAGNPETAAGQRLMLLARLDQLELVAPGGVLLSSGGWPERVATRDAALTRVPEAPTLALTEQATGKTLGFLARREVSAGDLSVSLVGGVVLNQAFLDEIAQGEAALLSRPNAAALSSGLGAELAAVEPPRGGGSRHVRADGRSWSVTGYPLSDAAGRELATVIVGVQGAGRALAIGDLLKGLGVGALAGIGLAVLAGAWIARRASRPVGELVRAVDAIAAGEADYTFSRQAEGELEELVTAFSRMHRTLALQQERVRAAERVAAWREVARHVAHEVKNPLAPIRLTVENLARARRTAPELFDGMFDEGVETILEEVERLRRLVGEFSEFARLPLPRRRPVDVREMIGETLALFAAEPDLSIERRDAEELPSVELDPDQFSRALKNVIGNAVEAMRAVDGGAKLLQVETRMDDGLLLIEVVDSGPGFSDEASERAFEPYFTTKEEGTGLGMPITYRIIHEHGGVIHAESPTGGGARVVIRLPPTQMPPGATEEPPR